MPSKTDAIQLETDGSFQKKEWRIQRVGWLLWALVIALGLAGWLGSGPLSSAVETTADGSFSVAYDRFLHYHHPTKLEMRWEGEAAGAEPVRIKVARGLLDRVQIERIEPEPERAEVVGDGIVYEFAHRAGEAGKAVFFVDYERFGRSEGSVELAGQPPVVLQQFVYP